MSGWESAFHFDSLVWDWIIAVYLFLAGVSAGAVMVSIYLKRKVIDGDPAKNGIIKAMAILAPMGIILGLLILIFHLQRPMMFWKILINYNPTSIMSMGVILFQVYMLVLFGWLGAIFYQPILRFVDDRISLVEPVLDFCRRIEKPLEFVLGILAFILAAYTGFLLSALKTFPLLNSPILPVLFVFSSLSSGVAASLFLGVIGFKESTHSPSVSWLHKIEKPVVIFELFVLITLFTGLLFGTAASNQAAVNALSGGFWASWFWWGVIVLGMAVPFGLNSFAPAEVRHGKGYIALVATLSLIGVLMLRTFILYAGQMTVI